jgi:hypothetical protein
MINSRLGERFMGNRGIDIDTLLGKVNKASEGKNDFIVNTDDIFMNNKAQLQGLTKQGSGFTMDFTRCGLNQTLAKTNIPGFNKYGMYLNDNDQQELLGDLFNKHNKQFEQKEMLIRSQNNRIRAFLTGRYSIIDNDFITQALYRQLADQNVFVTNDSVDDVYMNIRIRFNDLSINAGTLQNKDMLSVGLHISNSEVGEGSVTMLPMILREVCVNGMVVIHKTGDIFRQRHTISAGTTQEAILNKVNEVLEIGDKNIEQFVKARDEKVSNVRSVISDLAKSQKYSQKLTNLILDSYGEEPGGTKYDVANAFTAAARHLPDYIERIEVERFAGNLLSLTL